MSHLYVQQAFDFRGRDVQGFGLVSTGVSFRLLSRPVLSRLFINSESSNTKSIVEFVKSESNTSSVTSSMYAVCGLEEAQTIVRYSSSSLKALSCASTA